MGQRPPVLCLQALLAAMGTAVLSLMKSLPHLVVLSGLTLLEEINPTFW